MAKKGLKRKRTEAEKEKEIGKKKKQKLEEREVTLPPKRMSDGPVPKKAKWTNKQRVLVFASRGINHRDRHLMEDIKTLMPHHRTEAKMERSKNLQVVNEICEVKNCNKAILFEGRRKRDLYMWLSNVPVGPCGKFLVENIYTMGELKMTGNCLKGSRPLLSFDENFSTKPHYALLKELFAQIFGVPNRHPKSQPFFDHVYTFTVLDNKIWFRNFQILTEDGALAEIGPRFVLNPVKIFGNSFGGETLWDNPHYISPAKYRQTLSKKAGGKYMNKIEQKMSRQANKSDQTYALNPIDDIFTGEPLETAEKFENIESDKVLQDIKPVKKVSKKRLDKKTKKETKKKVVAKKNENLK